MSGVMRRKWQIQYRVERGPYADKSLRARVRRLREGWTPNFLYWRYRGWVSLLRYGRRPAPEIVVIPPWWASEAWMAWANEVAADLQLKGRA